MKKKEKNINVFNRDVSKNKGYLYTNDELYSAKLATTKQTEEFTRLINKHFPENLKIIDIGCGDGKHTLELFKNISAKSIVGIDPAKEAIKIAKSRVSKKYKGKVTFRVGNIYEVSKLFKKGQFDLAIIRGVLHHLYEPKKAIESISKVFPNVIVNEANGYNPILKVIEKVSPYHIEHEEKSYWPPSLNNWFTNRGYKIIEEKYSGIVPYFCPDSFAKLLKSTEPFFENLPIVNRLYCACNYIVYIKN